MYKFLPKAFTLSFLFLLPFQAQADDFNRQIARCAVMDGDLERLECYDNAADEKGLRGSQPVTTDIEDTGKWLISSEINPIDDSQTVTLLLKATSGVSSSFSSDPIGFIIRCKSGVIDAYFVWHDYIAGDDGSLQNVIIRIGDQKAFTERMGISTSNEGTFYPVAKGKLFILELSTAKKLIVQTTPYNESPVTAIFDISGLKNAMQPLASACNWKPDLGTWSSYVSDAFEKTYVSTSTYGKTDQNGNPAGVWIQILCRENETSLQIQWGDSYKLRSGHGYDTERVTTELDGKTQTKSWKRDSYLGNGVLYPSQAYLFVKQMLKASSFKVKIKQENSKFVTATFNLKGLSDAIKPVRKGCNW